VTGEGTLLNAHMRLNRIAYGRRKKNRGQKRRDLIQIFVGKVKKGGKDPRNIEKDGSREIRGVGGAEEHARPTKGEKGEEGHKGRTHSLAGRLSTKLVEKGLRRKEILNQKKKEGQRAP